MNASNSRVSRPLWEARGSSSSRGRVECLPEVHAQVSTHLYLPRENFNFHHTFYTYVHVRYGINYSHYKNYEVRLLLIINLIMR